MFQKLYRKFLIWLSSTKVYEWFLIHVIPYIRFSMYYTGMKGSSFHKMYKMLKPGHIILTTDKKKLTTFLIPGEFAHAAFCVSKDQNWEMSEMTHTHYTKSTFADVCFQADRVVIMECKDFDQQYINKIIDQCKKFEDVLYDFQFELGVKALSCAELIYESDVERRLDISLEDVAGLGRPYISPTGLFRAVNCEVIYDTEWENKNEDTQGGDRES